uniref:NADH-ubiquinone oxidoreductase chain 2 n=1 Tax=Saussurella borneensis TaxID=510017 RepID=A0A8F2JFG8_9ORTH|nr:NADH dehydrogenase subunit 2 [Saussurella borneensis]
MNKAPTKIIFSSILIIGSLMSISSNSWLGVWMGLEMNLMAFIPLISSSTNITSNEGSIKYFMVQTIASMIMITSALMMSSLADSTFHEMSSIALTASIFMKMGAAPFHFWFPEVMETLNWNTAMLLMTWQKIAPMMIISYALTETIMYVVIVSSAIIGAVMGLNQISLRLIMAYSSINHIGWMISAILVSKSTLLIYFFIYSFISITAIMTFKQMSSFYINQLYMSQNSKKFDKIMMSMTMMSLGGMPPLLGFLPKWLVINELVSKSLLITSVLVLTSTITLYFYLKITFSATMLSSNENKWNLSETPKYKITLTLMNMMSVGGLLLTTAMLT